MPVTRFGLQNKIIIIIAVAVISVVGVSTYIAMLLTRLPVAASIRYDLSWGGREPRGCLRVDVTVDGVKAQALIDTLDRAQPQVEIEARIVNTNKNYARALGIQ
jgi:uncharacterized iron-regulated membrane protein